MKGKFFKCECGSEGVYVNYDTVWGTELAFFTHGPQDRSWRNRLRLAYACLKGKPYADMILLNDQGLADFVDHLVSIQNRDSIK